MMMSSSTTQRYGPMSSSFLPRAPCRAMQACSAPAGIARLPKAHWCGVQGIQKMRAACRLAADVLEHAGTLVKVNSYCPTKTHPVAASCPGH